MVEFPKVTFLPEFLEQFRNGFGGFFVGHESLTLEALEFHLSLLEPERGRNFLVQRLEYVRLEVIILREEHVRATTWCGLAEHHGVTSEHSGPDRTLRRGEPR